MGGDPESVEELKERLEAVAAENFGRVIGQLVRAIDVWQGVSHLRALELRPPGWALEAREAAVRHMEFLAEQQQP